MLAAFFRISDEGPRDDAPLHVWLVCVWKKSEVRIGFDRSEECLPSIEGCPGCGPSSGWVASAEKLGWSGARCGLRREEGRERAAPPTDVVIQRTSS